MRRLISVPSNFAIILMGEERAGCFALIVFLMPCDCQYSVAFPHVPWVGLQCVIVVFPDHLDLRLLFILMHCLQKYN